MLKKFLIFAFCLICTSGCSPKDGVNEIVFSSWGSITEVRILKRVISDFEKENPHIKVKFLHIPQNYFQKLHLLFASNTPPDVLFINNLYLPLYQDYLEDLTPYMIKKNFYSQAIDALSIDNKLYALPRDLSNLILYVNTDLISIKPNWTMDDLLEILEKNQKTDFWGIGIEEDIYWLLPFLSFYGEKLDNNYDTKNSKAFSLYLDLRDKYNFLPTKSQIGSSTLTQMFLDGKLAMYVSGRWMYPKISESANFNWQISPLPLGKEPFPCDASGWAIAKKTRQKNASLALVKYLSEAKTSEYFTQTGLIVPARIDSARFLNNDMHNEKVFLEVITKSKKTFLPQNYKKLADKINKSF